MRVADWMCKISKGFQLILVETTSMKLGIFNSVFGRRPLQEVVQKTKRHGFDCVQLTPGFSDVESRIEAITPDDARKVRDAFGTEGIEIVGLAGYTNLMNPDLVQRKADLDRFKKMVTLCRHWGTDVIATETGSVSQKGPWTDCPENHEEKTFLQCAEVVRELVRFAEGHGVKIAIEGYVYNVVDTVRHAVRLRELIPSPSLGYVLDPNNYFLPPELDDVPGKLKEIFDGIAAHSFIGHAKDVAAKEGVISTPRAGTGRMDYACLASLLRERCPRLPMVMEHLTEEQVSETKAFVEKHLRLV